MKQSRSAAGVHSLQQEVMHRMSSTLEKASRRPAPGILVNVTGIWSRRSHGERGCEHARISPVR
jgi:hypothetical protein